MKIRFCGAAGTTTGSQHLLEINGHKILLDCGLFQGRRLDAYERNKTFLYRPEELNAVVLSHAHIDHSGNLPNLVKQGFNGNIYATSATRDLCQLMLADSAKIQADDAAYLNRKREKKGLPPIEPLYTQQESEYALRHFVTLDYHRTLPIAPGVTLQFFDAGHILGSAQVVLDIEENGARQRLLFSGDVGRGHNEILRDPDPVDGVDIMLMESTYGGRMHEPEGIQDEKLAGIIRKSLAERGKILIPAFAVERTQNLIYTLHKMIDAGAIPALPIYVDSPLAVNATDVFRLHPECFNDEIYHFLFERRNPFGFDSLTMVRDVQQSIGLNSLHEPSIIISASGMCEAGRILHHLSNNISNPTTTVLFVGYCAQDTLGWKLRNGAKKVNILGESYEVKARIDSIDSFSGHADHGELLSYFQKTGGAKKAVCLVHGEPECSQALADALRPIHSGKVEIAKFGEVADL